jgi:glycerophosphoryl diester phosphodiesterase
LRIQRELGCRLPARTTCIGENDWLESDNDYDAQRTAAGLAHIATYASGIGPWIPHIVKWPSPGCPVYSKLDGDAHAVGLEVHPYPSERMTFQKTLLTLLQRIKPFLRRRASTVFSRTSVM